MYEETTEGFKWVFNTFLECMKNKHPCTIFTNQCPAIAAGIRSVMPNTFHGLCIFHINENDKEKLKGKAAKDGIITDLNFLMKWVDTEDEFEARWQAMISKYYPNIIFPTVILGLFTFINFAISGHQYGLIIISPLG
ncbi:Protein FAR-RED IMPAIRED RESPONSE 1 [Linum perenne]